MGDTHAHDACTSLCGAFDEFSGQKNNCLKGVKWSPDGTCLLTASEDQQLRLYELPAELSGMAQDGGAAAPAPAAAGGSQEMSSAVRVAEGDSIYDYCWYPLMHSAEPSSCCFLSACRDHPMHLWDAYTGSLRASYAAYNHLDEITSTFSTAINPDGTRLYAGYDRAIRIFDLGRPGRQCELRATSKNRKSREGQRGIISCLHCSPDRCGLFAAGSFAGTTGLYVDNSPTMVCLLGGHTGGVTQVQFSHDGLHLYTGARQDGSVLCYDVRASQTPLCSFLRDCHGTNQRIGFDLSADSRALVTASRDGRVLVYDVQQPQAPPAVWLTYSEAVNGATLHPFLPLLAVAVGERRFPLPHDAGDAGGGGVDAAGGRQDGASDEDDDMEEDGEEEDEEEEEEEESARRAENGLQVWRLPQRQQSQTEAAGEPTGAAAATGVGGGEEAAASVATPLAAEQSNGLDISHGTAEHGPEEAEEQELAECLPDGGGGTTPVPADAPPRPIYSPLI